MILDKIINATYDKYFEESNTDFCDHMKNYFIFDDSLICELFKHIESSIKYADNGLWDEKPITWRIVGILLKSLQSKFPVNVFQNTGTIENKFGDIAFVVTFHLPNGKTFNGVAFIEAKKDYPGKNYKFDYFRSEQMNRFLENTTSSFYVFYSHKSFLPIIETSFLKQIIEGAEIKDGQLKIEHIITPPIN